VRSTGGAFREATVTGPLGERRRARWGLIDAGRTAVIEMAEAAGLPLVPPSSATQCTRRHLGSGS